MDCSFHSLLHHTIIYRPPSIDVMVVCVVYGGRPSDCRVKWCGLQKASTVASLSDGEVVLLAIIGGRTASEGVNLASLLLVGRVGRR